MYVEDANAAWKQALDAGCTSKRELQDMFWGDRMGSLIDPFHQHWSIAQHIEDVPESEMAERQKKFMEEMAANAG
jgi:PhnB protein